MSLSAPWFSMASDWVFSEMFDDLGDDERYLWALILTHAKAFGRSGKVKCDYKTLVRQYRTTRTEESFQRLMAAAELHGAIRREGNGFVTIENWDIYQNKRAKARLPHDPQPPQDEQGDESPAVSEKSATKDTSPTTKDTSPSPITSEECVELGCDIPRPTWMSRGDDVFQSLPKSLDTPRFRKAWMLWEIYQHDKRAQTFQPIQRGPAWSQLLERAPPGKEVEHAVRMIEQAMARHWKNFYQPEDKQHGSRNRSSSSAGTSGGKPSQSAGGGRYEGLTAPSL